MNAAINTGTGDGMITGIRDRGGDKFGIRTYSFEEMKAGGCEGEGRERGNEASGQGRMSGW